LWYFNEATSLARDDFRAFCKMDSQPALWEPEDEWTTDLQRNVVDSLRGGRPVRVFDPIEHIFGSTLGFARGTHLRAALRALDKKHAFATTPSGPFEDMVLVPDPGGLPDVHETPSLF
jgi:hypothetical protein